MSQAPTHAADRRRPGRDGVFIEKFVAARARLLQELHKVIIGQDAVIELLLAALFARGHCLLVGVPGLAKTLMISTLARVLQLEFNRIQFTPDLMPADITGHRHPRRGPDHRQARVPLRQGPGLRATSCSPTRSTARRPRRRRRCLQAMQEYQVTAGGTDVPAGAAVLRPRDAEPDRAGGDVPAARGAARPVHVHGEHRLPQPPRGAADRARDDDGDGGRPAAGAFGRGHHPHPARAAQAAR